MLPTHQGSIRIFRLFGINVFLHWSWFFVALYEIQGRSREYSSFHWNALEYVTLFLIVLLHEFGHSLACRSVGGQADQIILWPLGGVAYVSPPPRPGAMLWSIAAGPLVNVVLCPVLIGLGILAYQMGWTETHPNVYVYLRNIAVINTVLLIFNLLPIYPLDGGKIVWALLWFVCGRIRSLMIASVIGFIGVAALVPFAVMSGQVLTYVMLAFIGINCWRGFQQAQELKRRADAPKHPGLACPVCQAPPMVGSFWGCGRCRRSFDIFQTGGLCPQCGAEYSSALCLECGSQRLLDEWMVSPSVVPPKA